jgi:hypothetical protein
MKGTLQAYRRAVKDVVQESWAAGLPVFQIRKGYLVAVYPGGREVRLKRVNGGAQAPAPNDSTEAVAPRRAERRR